MVCSIMYTHTTSTVHITFTIFYHSLINSILTSNYNHLPIDNWWTTNCIPLSSWTTIFKTKPWKKINGKTLIIIHTIIKINRVRVLTRACNTSCLATASMKSVSLNTLTTDGQKLATPAIGLCACMNIINSNS